MSTAVLQPINIQVHIVAESFLKLRFFVLMCFHEFLWKTLNVSKIIIKSHTDLNTKAISRKILSLCEIGEKVHCFIAEPGL